MEGTYQFQLQVTDDKGAIGTSVLEVIVNAAANIPPVANAGTSQAITLPLNTITLHGSGTDADGTIVSYLWTKISGPESYKIANAASAVTSITNLLQGIYQFKLEVKDNKGAIGTDIIQVVVNPAPNQPPVANAGADATITLPVNSLILSGSGSDADGNIVSYNWAKVSGPAEVNIINSSSASTNITGLVQGIYQFQLTVTDNNGAISTDMVQVTVNPAPNKLPVAQAGSDITIALPVNNITLSGSGTDADGTIVSYSWSKVSGPSNYNIANSGSAVTNVSGLVDGVYQFQLKVTDNEGATATDIITVKVNPVPNQSPVANAGVNQTIVLPVNSVTLSGSGIDPDGKIVNYEWTRISGPASNNIVSPSSAITNITGLVQGIYLFELKVTDNSGAKGNDTVQITVNPAVNIPPVANAGTDKIITLPISTTSLSGSGNDVDGSIVKYLWTKISGPADYKMVNAGSPVTDVFGLKQGIYQFELKVTDDKGAEGKDTVQVTVNKTNVPPVADAGKDQTITLPEDSVNLTGKGTDSDGIIVSYSWKQLSGSSISSIISPSGAATLVNNLQGGTYTFELSVTDNNGVIGKDTVNIVVTEPRISQTPSANKVKIYPNPVVDIATLDINTTQTNSKIQIIITDMLGKTVYKNEVLGNQSNMLTKIDCSNLVKGTYVVSVYFTNTEKKILKIVKL